MEIKGFVGLLFPDNWGMCWDLPPELLALFPPVANDDHLPVRLV